jgi:hypothetical protein
MGADQLKDQLLPMFAAQINNNIWNACHCNLEEHTAEECTLAIWMSCCGYELAER